MKRTYNLYRVSTKKQVKISYEDGIAKDDIPMQKQACREFAAKQGWLVVKEFEEKGVSGFKVSANNRDAIQDLKEAALNKEFDVLLVFMFDRIGRIDDETPFVVEWFAKHGIEVWSVREGEQRFDSHVDKLTNYIRFWQASGESEKTSMRIKTRMRQLTLEGVYTGGHVPFGYHLVKNGRVNRKGYELSDLEIDVAEAEIVRWIFHKTANEGIGSYRLANMLNEQGIRTHNGSKFQCNTILRILRNRIYCGYLSSGDVTSEQLKRLQIIEEELFNRVQFILDQRQIKDDQKRQIALSTKGKSLLSGNVFCAHCGGKLTTIHYHNKRVRRDGSVYESDSIKYSCYHKSRKLCECDGQSTYRADKVDEIVCELVKKLFANINEAPEEGRMEYLYKRYIAGNKANQKKLEVEISKSEKQLENLQLEIGKTLTGDSTFSPQDLSAAIHTLKDRIDAAKSKLAELAEEENNGLEAISIIKPAYSQFKSWSEEFDNATLEQKKMIAGQLFQRIEVGRDYKINFVLNMTYQQFCEEWQNLNEAVSFAG